MTRTIRRAKAVGTLPLALAAAALLLAAIGQILLSASHDTSLPLIILGWLLVAAGLAPLALAARRLPAAGAGPGLPLAVEAAALGLILILSVVLRLYNLDVQPNGCFRDEGEAGNVAIQIMNGEEVYDTGTSTPVYIEYIYQNAAGFFYPVATFFKAFGVDVKSVRLVSVFYGVLSVLAFYFLARLLLGAPLGLFLALVMAGLRWHINFSRIGFLGMMTVFLELPLFYFLWQGLRATQGSAPRRFSNRGLLAALALALARPYLGMLFPGLMAGHFTWLLSLAMILPLLWFLLKGAKDRKSGTLMLAGACLALSLYSYLAARLLIAAVLAALAYEYLARPGLLKGQRLALFIAGLALLALAALAMVQGSASGSVGLGRLGLALGALGALCLWAFTLASLSPWLKPGAKALLTLAALLSAYGLKVAFTDGGQLSGGPLMSPAVLWSGRWCLVAAAAILAGILATRSGEAWFHLRPVALAAGAFVVVALPLLNYAMGNFDQMFTRASRVSIFNDRELEGDNRSWGAKLKENIPRTLGMYNVMGDGNPRHNLPGEPMLNPALAAVFALGALFLLLNIRQPLPFFLLAWWQATLLGGYFSQEAPQAYRTITAIPVVLLIAGAGLQPALSACAAAWRRWGRGIGYAALALLALGGTAYEVDRYFNGQGQHSACWAEFSATEYLMGKELKSHPNTRGLFRPDWADSWTVKFITYPERDYTAFDPSRDIPLRGQVDLGKNYLFVLDEAYRPLLPMLKAYYPGGTYAEEHQPFTQERLDWSYYVPAAQVAASAGPLKNGLSASYYKDTGQAIVKGDSSVLANGEHWANRVREKVDPFILFNWTVDPVQAPFSVEWSGRILADQAGLYEFSTTSNDYCRLEIDGRKVLERPHYPAANFDALGKIQLSKGSHRITLRYYEARNYSRMELWWRRPGGEREVVPSQVLLPE
jgi:hypothetical protein